MTDRDRNGLIDYMRLAACVDVGWFHMGGPYWEPARIGLDVFILLTVVYACGATAGAAATVRRRARRLLVPWLIWSALYLAARTAAAAAAGDLDGLADTLSWTMLLYGPVIHLWFLPAMFVAGLAAAAAAALLPKPALFALGLVGALVTLSVRDAVNADPASAPFGEWMYAAPVAFAALALFAARGRPLPTVLLIVALAAAAAIFEPLHASRTVIALAATALGLAIVMPAGRTSEWCGQASLFIYLIHPLIGAALGRAGLDRGALLAAATIAASAALAALWTAVNAGKPKPAPHA